MVSWTTQSDALWVVKTLFSGSAVAALVCFFTDRYVFSLLKNHWKLMLCCVALVLLWRIPAEGGFFHGTEYEDSYVYTVAGRQMASPFRIAPSGTEPPYSITVCTVGSLNLCKRSGNFPEHLIGYPYILSVASNIFGYKPSIGSFVNIAFACLSDILIFLICMVIADDVIAAGSAAFIFAITPVFAVWGLETSAEPFSNACMSLVLWFCMRHLGARPAHSGRWHVLVTWFAFTAVLLFSLTVKRENILLLIVLPVIALFVQFTAKDSGRTSLHRSGWILLSAVLGVILCLQMSVFQPTTQETALLKAFPLSFTQIAGLLPVYLRSFFVIEWFGGAVFLVLLGAIVAWRRKALELFPLLLFVAYVLLYAFHIRGYYEMASGSTDSRSALRFSMNLMTLWCVLAGLGTSCVLGWVRGTHAWEHHKVAARWIAAGALAVVLGLSYFATGYLREDVVGDEFRMRIEPSLTAARVAVSDCTKENYVATAEPLITQMYAEPSTNVIALYDVNRSVLQSVGFLEGKTGVVYLDEEIHRTPADTERYKKQLEYLNQLECNTLIRNEVFSVIRICTETTVHDVPHAR
jgi:hypothetical protein